MAIMIGSLDQGNPLYLHANDSNCASICSVKLTGVDNYGIWASAMKLALQIKHKMGFITGHVFSIKAATVWNELKDTYDRIDGSIMFNLLQKTNSFKQGGLPISEYYHKLNSLWREYEILTKLPDYTCSARLEVANYDKILKLMQFLMGLDDIYQPIRSSILTREVLPEAKDAFLIISREESHRGIPSSYGTVKTEKAQASAFVSKQSDMNRSRNNNWSNNGNNVNRGVYDNLLCKNCGLKGHTIERCFELIGYPPGFKRNLNLKPNTNGNSKSNSGDFRKGSSNNSETKTSGNVSFTNEQVMKLMSLLNDKGSAGQSNMAGANQRMTNSIKDMVNLVDVSDLKLTVGHPNITLAKITHVGNLKLNNDVMLFDVLVIPEYTVSLLSVHKLIKDSKLIVGFDETKCYIQVLKKGRVLGTGSEFGGLYLFDKEYDKSTVANNSKFVSCFVSKEVWHCRLGHPANQVLKLLKGSLNLSNIDHEGPYESVPKPKASISPNDDEEGSSCRDGSVHQSGPSHSFDQPEVDEQIPTLGSVFQNQTKEVNLRKSSRTTKLPAKFNKYVLDNKVKYGLNRYVNHTHLDSQSRSFISNLNKTLEPSSFKEASKDPNWISDMNDEMNALYENDTWYLVDLPFGRKPIGSKRVIKIKYKSDGEVDRFKARVVAKGFGQKEGLDYEETCSPVVKMGTVRCLLSLAVQNEWDIYQMDINNAFLYGDLIEEVYMLPPPGFFDPSDKRVCTSKVEIAKFKYFLSNRPDISYAVHCLSQHMHAPLKLHFDIALILLKYLKLAPGFGVQFVKRYSGFDIKAFSDSDWAKCPVTRRSMAAATCEIMWIVKILSNLNIKNLLPAELYCDNKAAMQIATNPVMHEKTKNFDLDVHFIREKVGSGLIKTVNVESKDNVADILTKALGSFQHGFLTKKFAGDVVLRESYKPKTRGKLYYACPRSKPRENTFGCEFLWKEERIRLLVSFPGASTTLIYSPGSSSTPIYSPGSSSTLISSPKTSRNAECSNYKHLLDKITILEAAIPEFVEDNDEDTDTKEDIKEGKLKGEDGESPFLEVESDVDEVPKTIFAVNSHNGSFKEVSVGKKDSRSEDPFNIYELLKKNKRDDKKSPCVDDSLKYPPGFIPVDVTKGSLKKDDGFNKEDHECSQSIHVDEKEDVAEFFCSGHFKKSKAPHTSGSIVELIDDLVKVGQTMGYNMDGCIKNIGMIIDPQGANGVVIIMGDFNEVRTKDERFGSVLNKQGAEAFNMFISNTSLEEVPLGGFSFTWCHNYATKMSKLDRFLISESLMSSCPNIFTVSLDRYLSDHRPILLREAKYDYGPIPFWFFHYLFEVEGLDKLVEDTWNEAPVNDSNAMSRMLKKVEIFKREVTSFVIKSLQDMENLQSLEAAQKDKIKWAIEGDENLKYYHDILNKKRSQLTIHGILVDDDVVFVGQWSDPNIDIIVHVLDCFYRASGLCINMNKSKLMGVAVEDDKVVQAVMKIGCVTIKAPFSYLGSKVGGSMSRVQLWNEFIDRVVTRLSNWKMKTLSIGGRLTLIKSVLGSMPIYDMSIFKVRMKVLQRLESIRCHFFNGNELLGKKPIWVKWKSVLASKEKGGLGVSSLYALNRALMFKWVWRFFTHGSSLWARVIKAIHGVDGKIGTTAKATFLLIWVDIIREAEKIKVHGIDLASLIHKKLGNGANTSFRDNKWHGGDRAKEVVS
uniref:Ribonuclease H-like domain-containing protein n=1 Tax=Tanacetum cinerariifolium TaxID=118510 RepID=A0A6L2KPW9_TANCI|nr:ribonuclease H-like domain-containing protein [Tanacetum cinerariifolium]